MSPWTGPVLSFLIATATASAVQAEAVALDEEEALQVSQAVIGQPLDNVTLRDTERQPMTLDALRGKPLVINLIYTACSHTCPLVLQTLDPAIERAEELLGRDSFNIATVGFDVRHDTPERMRAFAREQGIDHPNWRFLSADQPTVDTLIENLGFTVYPSPQGFDHLAQTTIIDQEGRIYRHVYGADFEIPAIVEPLMELVFGQRSSWSSLDGIVNRVRLFCSVYDPRSERYRFDYSIIIGTVIGIVALSAVAIVLVREWRRSGQMRSGL
ncbi:MAG: SCO family protein [Geminicoccaceae bacterium]